MELFVLFLAVGNIPCFCWKAKSFPRGACDPRPFTVLGCAALLSDESSSDESSSDESSPDKDFEDFLREDFLREDFLR
jgi:hypothetical protein